MIEVQEFLPSSILKETVRLYQYCEMKLQGDMVRKPVSPRPEQCLQFSFQDPYTIINRIDGTSCKAPPIVIAGRQTKRNIDLLASGNVITFTIQFQPVGFYRLFHIPLLELTNLTPDAGDVMGSDIRILYEQLHEASSPIEMAFLAETFLLKQMKLIQPLHPVQSAVASIFSRHGQMDMALLASTSSMSLRQFERSFNEQVGVPPKLFSRIVRFTYALDLKYSDQQRSWTDVAFEAGYYDQMHLIHECKMFTEETPTAILKTWSPCRRTRPSFMAMFH